jgi:hypothetical protein
MKSAIFWDITLATCFHADVFRGLYDPEDGGDFPLKRRLTFNGLTRRYIPEDSILQATSRLKTRRFASQDF